MGLSLWLTNLRGAEVYAQFNNAGVGVDLHVAFSIKYTNGVSSTVFGASNPSGANKHQLEVRIFGDNGQMVVDLERELVWFFRSPEDQTQLELQAGEGLYNCQGPVDALIDLAQGKKVRNSSPADLGARAVEIIAGAYKSTKSGRMERL